MTTAIEATDRWLPFGTPAGDVRLYCLPHAGGSASAYRPWLERIDGVAVCPLQPPGRDTRFREAPHQRMAPMAREIADVVLAQDPSPYAVFGHSLGALVGFEVLREIKRRGGPEPVHFFASGCPAPDFVAASERVTGMPDGHVVELIRRLGGTPDWVLADEAVLAMILPPFRADFAVKETYRYLAGPPLSTPITVIAGSDDHQAGAATMAGWREQTTAACREHTLTGGHFAVLQRPALPQRIIADALAASAVRPPLAGAVSGRWSGGPR